MFRTGKCCSWAADVLWVILYVGSSSRCSTSQCWPPSLAWRWDQFAGEALTTELGRSGVPRAGSHHCRPTCCEGLHLVADHAQRAASCTGTDFSSLLLKAFRSKLHALWLPSNLTKLTLWDSGKKTEMLKRVSFWALLWLSPKISPSNKIRGLM